MKIFIIFMVCQFIIIADALRTDVPVWSQDQLTAINSGIEVKYMAGLFENNTLFCSGAFISQIHILTLALCLVKFFTVPYARFEDYYAESGITLTPFDLIQYQFQKVEIHKDYNLWNRDLLHGNLGLITVMDLEHSLYDYVPKSSFSIAKDDIKPLLHAYAIGWGDHRELSTVKEKELYCVMLKVTEIIPTCQSILKVKQLNYDSIFCADKRCIGEFSKWDDYDLGALLMNNKVAYGILCALPKPFDATGMGVYVKLKKYDSWITMAKQNESDRIDQGRIFRMRKSIGIQSL